MEVLLQEERHESFENAGAQVATTVLTGESEGELTINRNTGATSFVEHQDQKSSRPYLGGDATDNGDIHAASESLEYDADTEDLGSLKDNDVPTERGDSMGPMSHSKQGPHLTLDTLLPEIHHEIFDRLKDDRVSSISFALTCRTLYSLHWARNGKVPIDGTHCDGQHPPCEPCQSDPLIDLLGDSWMPDDLSYCWNISKFATLDRRIELRDMRVSEQVDNLMWLQYCQEDVTDLQENVREHMEDILDDDSDANIEYLVKWADFKKEGLAQGISKEELERRFDELMD